MWWTWNGNSYTKKLQFGSLAWCRTDTEMWFFFKKEQNKSKVVLRYTGQVLRSAGMFG